MNVKYNLITCAFIFLLTSCVSYRYIDIQVLQPGSVNLPSNIRTLHIIEPGIESVDHDIAIRSKAHGNDFYYKLFVQAFDSVLNNYLHDSPDFNDVIVLVQKNNQWQDEARNIPIGEKEKHGVLSIVGQTLIDTIKPDTYIPDNEYGYSYYSFYSLYCRSKIEFTNPGRTKFYDTYIYSDTLTWSYRSMYADEASLNIPSASEAILQTADKAAGEYAHWLAPYWVSDERMLFYSNNKYMRLGYNFFVENKLTEAIQSWKYIYEAGTPLLASVAAHNIALAYEMLDDYDSSETWLNNSLTFKWHIQTEYYLGKIRQRIKFKQILDKQFKR
jgi:hypothetical protein